MKNLPPLGSIIETEGEMAGTQTLRSNQTGTIKSAYAPTPDGAAYSASFKLNETNDAERSGTFRDYRATATQRQQQLSQIEEEYKSTPGDVSREHNPGQADGFFLTSAPEDPNQSDLQQ